MSESQPTIVESFAEFKSRIIKAADLKSKFQCKSKFHRDLNFAGLTRNFLD